MFCFKKVAGIIYNLRLRFDLGEIRKGREERRFDKGGWEEKGEEGRMRETEGQSV